MFNKDSALVQVWVRLIKNQTYTINDIPNLSNLKEIVTMLLSQSEEDNEQSQKAEAFDYITGRNENNE